ncbi:cation transport protein ChaC [Yoonia sediminilitoris]|uniref:glutathione-specific gamma-glutamylcyclotransferase n=2 Tax=Yoonia sediminilitoris TaxID=1286148 RepID=A0A2T6KBI0_9RHOB|nr:cation transport protein ChaC [Yoonia sediminilitoris]RCW93004.1 cation transport protein ChaC [Yoonia sediminilitoris]
MWDPSVEFDEVRHARCIGYQHSFCLWDDGGRGSIEEPGLMFAIDADGSCEGLAFRVPQKKLDRETFVLFQREILVPVYRPTWLSLDTIAGPIEALGFVANHDHSDIKPGIPLLQQAEMIARATGMFGGNFDYLSDLHERLDLLEVDDTHISELYATSDSLRRMSHEFEGTPKTVSNLWLENPHFGGSIPPRGTIFTNNYSSIAIAQFLPPALHTYRAVCRVLSRGFTG